MKKRIQIFNEEYKQNIKSYDDIYAGVEGWISYAELGNTYNLRRALAKEFESLFPTQVSCLEVNRLLKIAKSFSYPY